MAVLLVMLAVFAASPQIHASVQNECEALFRPVKNVGAKTELQSQLDAIESRLADHGVRLNELKLSIRRGDRARVSIYRGDLEVAYGFLRPSEQSVHVGHVSVENIRVNLGYSSRGLGSLTYLLLAREAIRAGHILESSWDLTDEARGVWLRLVKLGWAKKVDYLFNEFQPAFIRAPENIDTIDRLAARFTGP